MNKSNQNTDNNFFDMQNMMNLIEMMNKFQSVTSQAVNMKPDNHSVHSNKSQPHKMTAVIRAAIPYLSSECRKNVGIFVQLLETKEFIENEEKIMATKDTMAINSKSDNIDDWRVGMLSAVREYADPDNQNKIDFLIRLCGIKDLLKSIIT